MDAMTAKFLTVRTVIRLCRRWPAALVAVLAMALGFVGAAVATRRNDHLHLTAVAETLHGAARLAVETAIRLVVLGVALCLVYFGYINFLVEPEPEPLPPMVKLGRSTHGKPTCSRMAWACAPSAWSDCG